MTDGKKSGASNPKRKPEFKLGLGVGMGSQEANLQWDDFARTAPEIAGPAEARFREEGFCFLGTIKRDGTPRISPVEATFAGGRLVFGMPHKSLKAIDLKRDPRCSIHSAVTSKDNTCGDFKFSGIAEEILDESLFFDTC